MYPRSSHETSCEFDVPAIPSAEEPEFVMLVVRPDRIEDGDPKVPVTPEVRRRAAADRSFSTISSGDRADRGADR